MLGVFYVLYRHTGNNSCLNFLTERFLGCCCFLTGKYLGENRALLKLIQLLIVLDYVYLKAEGRNYLVFCCWNCLVFSRTKKKRKKGDEKGERGKHFNAYKNLFRFSFRHQN